MLSLNYLRNSLNLALAQGLALTQHQHLGCQLQQVSEALPQGVAVGGNDMCSSVLDGDILFGSTLAPPRPHLNQAEYGG